jgi:heme ABC exporter ATP-binding subunit CcmA
MPSHDEGSLLEARGLQRSFGRVRIIRGLDLTLRPGESLAIIGPNGAGKTTLLRLVAGLLRPDAGEVRILGQTLRIGAHTVRSAVGFVSHQTLLYDDLTLVENLAFTARLYGLDRPVETAVAALEAAGLADRRGERPRGLSRGLQQRAAVARALLHAPRLILMDEPFTALDATAAQRLRHDLRSRLAGDAGLVLVTHQLADAWELASRVAVLIQGQWAADEPRAGSLDSFLLRYRGWLHE